MTLNLSVTFNKLYLGLLSAIIFLVPSNLFLKFFVQQAYASGILIDYLIPKIYLSDFAVCAVLGLWLFENISRQKINLKKIIKKHATKKNYLLFSLLGILIVRQFFTPHPLAAFWFLLKIFEMFLFGVFLYTHRSLLKSHAIFTGIIVTILFQSLVGLYQFYFQHSVAGYWFLGETDLSNWYGLAKIVINGVEKIEPYGTTTHPNVLAGILAIYSLIIISSFKDQKKSRLIQLIKSIAISLAVIVMLLTGSVSAWLTFGVGLATLFVFKKTSKNKTLLTALFLTTIIPIAIYFAHNIYSTISSLNRREYLQEKSLALTTNQPLLGVGLNQFTNAMTNTYAWSRENFIQPVHHVGLLWLAETGLLGILMLFLIFNKMTLKFFAVPLLILAPIAAFDHYLLTLQSGLLLSLLTLTYFSEK